MKRSFQQRVNAWKTLFMLTALLSSSVPAFTSNSNRPGIFFDKGRHHTTFNFLKVANLIALPVLIDEISLPMNLLMDTGASASLMIHKKNASLQHAGNQNRRPLGVGMGGILKGRSLVVNNFQVGEFQITKDFKAQLPNEQSYRATMVTLNATGPWVVAF